jgi:hypothetical protein
MTSVNLPLAIFDIGMLAKATCDSACLLIAKLIVSYLCFLIC